MDRSQLGFDQNFSGAADDFPSLLRRKGLLGPAAIGPMAQNATQQQTWQPTEATTILAFKFSGGVLVAGDRRATAGNTVVYDRADKVLEIDRQSIMAIAGVPATAWEMARVLEHSLQYFRRTQLQEMSVDGKVRALSKLLRDNFGFVMQGVGVVVPIFATYDGNSKPEARLYFYDAMGAQFEATDYAATGSGSPAVRGILYYENNWGAKRLHKIERTGSGIARTARARYGCGIRYGDGGRGSHRKDLSHNQDCVARRHHHFAREQNRRRVQRNGCMIEEPYRWVEAIANRREYIEGQLAPGSPIAALGYREGILFVTLGQTRQKLFEIYDRIAMGAIGHPGDIERLRMAAIELASTEGFTRSAG